MNKFTVEDSTLYHGDSMLIMKDLIDSADCVVTDPPYKLTTGGGNPAPGSKRMSGVFSASAYNNDGNIVDCDVDWPDFMPLLLGVLKQGHAYVMCNNRHIANCENAALSAGFKLHNWLVWDKVSGTPNRWYMKNCEFTGFFYKGKAKYINDCGCNQLTRLPHRDDSDHPTEKPVALMEPYIRNSTQPGDTVIDPFMGSGSTGVAAVRLGRKFIGIEKDKKWFDVAYKRISETNRIIGMFD